MKGASWLQRGWLGALLIVGCAAVAAAAERQSLARLVPENAGLCVEIHDLSGALQSLDGGPLVARWRQIPEVAGLLSLVERGAETYRGALRKQLGVTQQQAQTLFGGNLAIAVWPPKERDGQGTGVLLLACDDRELLARVEAQIIDQQSKAGKLGDERKVRVGDRDVVVHSIIGSDGSRPQLAVVDDLALLATQQTAFDEIIAGVGNREIATPLANLPAYQVGTKRLDPAAPIRVFLNPRVWDAAMQASPVPQSKRTRFVRDGILGVWEASDYAVASATLGPAIQLELFVACEQSRLPEPFRALVASATGPAELAARMPADSLAIVAARLDAGRVLRALFDNDTVAKYWSRLPNSIGWAGAMAVIEELGPNATVALCSNSNDREASNLSPIGFLAGLAMQPIEGNAAGQPLGPSSLALVCETLRWMSKASEANNRQSAESKAGIRIETIEHAGLELFGITWLVRTRPEAKIFLAQVHASKQSPAVVWLGDSLVRVAQSVGGKLGSEVTRWRKLHNERVGEPSDLVFVDLAGIRQTLADSPEAAVKLLAGSRGDLESSERKLKDVLARLQAADTLLGEVRLDQAGLGASLRIACDGSTSH